MKFNWIINLTTEFKFKIINYYTINLSYQLIAYLILETKPIDFINFIMIIDFFNLRITINLYFKIV